jgi:uncharacterized protein (TIGR02391 family)
MMQIGNTPMTRTRVEADGTVTTAEILADDVGNGEVHMAVDADIEVGDEVSYTLPNGKTRTMRITEVNVYQAPGGFTSTLDHTECNYEVVTTKPIGQPKRVGLPGMHPLISAASGSQIASRHYDEAVFNAFKAVEDRVQHLTGAPKTKSGSPMSGKPLMASIFDEQNPALDITSQIANDSQKADEAEGFKFLFMGGALGIRNPRGHGPDLQTDEQEALEMLALASLLMRRLDRAEERLPQPRHTRPIQKLPPGIGGAVSRS